ncbi:MAG TPA: hypothetical protein P5307_11380, partial [Pirellulaceae bacterium]|nr:hypothetical protein [Pirellulaceae bacterium]
MRSFLFGFVAIILLAIPACNFRSSNSEAEVAPATPTPIPDSNPVASSTELVEEFEPIITEPTPEPEFTLDPAPAPPTETWSASDEAIASDSSSADKVL